MDRPQIIDETQMPPELDARIRALLCLVFAKDAAVFSHTRCWHGSGPAFSAILEHEGLLVAHVGIVARTLRIGGESLRASGVQNVCVHPDWRGRRLSDAVMLAAMAEASRRNFDLGLLFCWPALEKVYVNTGWLVTDRLVVRQEEGRDLPLPEGNITMWLPLRCRHLPPGTIDLCGNDW